MCIHARERKGRRRREEKKGEEKKREEKKRSREARNTHNSICIGGETYPIDLDRWVGSASRDG